MSLDIVAVSTLSVLAVSTANFFVELVREPAASLIIQVIRSNGSRAELILEANIPQATRKAAGRMSGDPNAPNKPGDRGSVRR